MKKLYLLGSLALLTANFSFSQTDAVERNVTIEDKLFEVTAICMDAVETPTKYNEYVKPFLLLPDFPKKPTSITNEEFKKNIHSYFVKHPNLMDEILKERKITHDKLYGPRPY